jgi:hypothetical protein
VAAGIGRSANGPEPGTILRLGDLAQARGAVHGLVHSAEILVFALPKGHQRDLVLNIGYSWLFLLTVSAMQAAMVAWRAGMTSRHVLRTLRGMPVPDSLLRWGRPQARFLADAHHRGGGTAGILYGMLTHATVH